MEKLAGLSGVADAYDALLCDVWGVLHNGERLYEAAVEALRRTRARGGRVVLISNAPRPGALVGDFLLKMGLDAAVWDAIVTSGDMTRAALAAGDFGRRIHHIGPPRDAPLFDGLDLAFVGASDAESVVCTGLMDDTTETAEDYRAQFEPLVRQKKRMVCANPDRVVQRGRALIPCAGALAALYERLGGAVVYFGKPHREIYAQALSLIGGDAARCCVIGDGVATDIAGAQGAGLPSLFITGGIAADDLGADPTNDAVAAYMQKAGLRPTNDMRLMRRLCW